MIEVSESSDIILYEKDDESSVISAVFPYSIAVKDSCD